MWPQHKVHSRDRTDAQMLNITFNNESFTELGGYRVIIKCFNKANQLSFDCNRIIKQTANWKLFQKCQNVSKGKPLVTLLHSQDHV